MYIDTIGDLEEAEIMDLSDRSLRQLRDAAGAYEYLFGGGMNQSALIEMEEAAYDALQRDTRIVLIDPNYANEIHQILEELAYFEVEGLDFSCREVQNLESEFQRQLAHADYFNDLPEDVKENLLREELGWDIEEGERPASQA